MAIHEASVRAGAVSEEGATIQQAVTTDANSIRIRDLLLIALVGLVTLLPYFGQTREVSSHEITHAEIAREMARSGDFLIPRDLGREYSDKPVFHAAIAAVYRLAGHPSIGLARVPSICAAILGALALYAIGVALAGRPAALLAALAILGIQGYAFMARVARPDMIQVMAMFVSCAAIAHALRSSPGARRELLIVTAGVACGLATLIKGPLGFAFPILFAAVTSILPRASTGRIGVAESALFAVCVLATIAAWAAPAFLRDHGAYLTSVVTQPDLSWHPDRTSREFYWYAAVLATGFLPLVLLLPAVAMDVRRQGWTVAVVTSIAMLAILMIAPKKRLHYLLPVYPFLTLAVAEAVVRFRDVRWLERLTWSVVGLSLVAGPIYYGLIQRRTAPAQDPELEFASALLSHIEPTVKVVCVDDECDAIALVGRRDNIFFARDADDLVRQLHDAGGYAVISSEFRDNLLRRIDGRLELEPVFTGLLPDSPDGKHWRVYRVDAVAH